MVSALEAITTLRATINLSDEDLRTIEGSIRLYGIGVLRISNSSSSPGFDANAHVSCVNPMQFFGIT
jgi:hypothetical protein